MDIEIVILTHGKTGREFRFLTCTSFIVPLVYPVGGEGCWEGCNNISIARNSKCQNISNATISK